MKYGKFYAVNGMDKTEIECDGEIELHTDDGRRITLQLRQSDGEISLEAKDQLVVYPLASNLARVDSLKHK